MGVACKVETMEEPRGWGVNEETRLRNYLCLSIDQDVNPKFAANLSF
jgi:hypothetical protein